MYVFLSLQFSLKGIVYTFYITYSQNVLFTVCLSLNLCIHI